MPDSNQILVIVEHPHGRIEALLSEWIAIGPGSRELLSPCAAKHRETDEALPLSVIPLRYRNNTVSRLLIRLGVLSNPWARTQ